MRKQTKEQQISADLTAYFEQAKRAKCPASMKQGLYKKIGLNQSNSWSSNSWFKPAMACSFVMVCALGLVWKNHNQLKQQQLAAAERDMQIAMHYMQKISVKTLEDTHTLGIKPAIIVPVSKSLSQI